MQPLPWKTFPLGQTPHLDRHPHGQTPPPGRPPWADTPMVNEGAVRILLECILVNRYMFTTEVLVWIGSLNIDKQQSFTHYIINWLIMALKTTYQMNLIELSIYWNEISISIHINCKILSYLTLLNFIWFKSWNVCVASFNMFQDKRQTSSGGIVKTDVSLQRLQQVWGGTTSDHDWNYLRIMKFKINTQSQSSLVR